jgi:hypothetical protein
MSVTMWEVRAADGRAAELLAWVLSRTAAGSQVYQSVPGSGTDAEETRLVVIDPSGTARQRLADPPAGLVARAAHAWDFDPVRNV